MFNIVLDIGNLVVWISRGVCYYWVYVLVGERNNKNKLVNYEDY